MPVRDRLVGPLGPLVSALAAVGLGWLFIERGWKPPALVVVAVAAALGVAFAVGRSRFPTRPWSGSILMESSYGFLLLAAAVAGALLFWLAVEKTPRKDAAGVEPSPLTTQTFAGAVGAVTAYLGSVAIKLESPGNPVKKRLKAEYGGKFQARRDNIEKDAGDAVAYGDFSPLTGGGEISGWAWDARRRRSRLVQNAVDAGYL